MKKLIVGYTGPASTLRMFAEAGNIQALHDLNSHETEGVESIEEGEIFHAPKEYITCTRCGDEVPKEGTNGNLCEQCHGEDMFEVERGN